MWARLTSLSTLPTSDLGLTADLIWHTRELSQDFMCKGAKSPFTKQACSGGEGAFQLHQYSESHLLTLLRVWFHPHWIPHFGNLSFLPHLSPNPHSAEEGGENLQFDPWTTQVWNAWAHLQIFSILYVLIILAFSSSFITNTAYNTYTLLPPPVEGPRKFPNVGNGRGGREI